VKFRASSLIVVTLELNASVKYDRHDGQEVTELQGS
jgi:hypothetical protein